MAEGGPAQGQVYVSGWQQRLVTTRLLPRPVLVAIGKAVATIMRRQIRKRDRLDSQKRSPAASDGHTPIYFADIYHGGATFWDWVILPGGGLWWHVLWPLVVETTSDRLCTYPELRAVLELDAHTYEELEATRKSSAIARLRSVIASGRMEIADGTYAQPLAQTIGGEANIRHFFYGLDTIARVLGTTVQSFVAGEPQFFPQLPQVLAGFGIDRAVFRTHWAPFGTDPAADTDVVRWRGPDGSEVRAVPRYSCMDYDLMKDGHPGVQNAEITGGDFEQWSGERKQQFADTARHLGVHHPFITRLVDPKPPESPFPSILSAEQHHGSRLVTIKEYFDCCTDSAPIVSYSVDEIPSTIPWGLAGEQLHREQVKAESALLIAERLDAILDSLGDPGRPHHLDDAWKLLLRAQHHDLHLCSPWRSTRHQISMGEVGCDFARRSAEQAEAVAAPALEALARRFGPRAPRAPGFLLFNPSPWPRQELVQLPAGGAAEVWQGDTQLVAQTIADHGNGAAVAFVVQLPPLGVDIVELRPAARDDTAPHAPVHLPVDRDPLADALGARVSGAVLTVWHSDNWHRSDIEQLALEVDGPVFRRYRRQGRLLDLPFTQEIIVVPILQRVQLSTDIDFGSGRHLGPQLADHRTDLAYYIQDDKKLCLNFSTRSAQLFCDSPFFLVEPQGPRFNAVSFVGLAQGEGGVLIAHRGTPGWHVDREGGIVRNVLAWGPEQWLYASDDSITPGRSRHTAVRGTHRYEHAVAATRTRLDAIRRAHDFRLPVLAVDLPAGEGSRGVPWSFLRVAPEDVVLTALFARGGHTYARLWNARADATALTLGEAAGALPVSLRLEDEPVPAWPQLRPWGIQTVRLSATS